MGRDPLAAQRASLAWWSVVARYRLRRWQEAQGNGRPKWHEKHRKALGMVVERERQIQDRTGRVSTPSPAAVTLIRRFESGAGPDGSFRPYQDVVGGWTIGYGHTWRVGPDSRPLSEAEAQTLLLHDLHFRRAPAVTAAAKRANVRLTQSQFDALVSFVYNRGVGMLEPSHTIGRHLRQGRLDDVADDLLLYDSAGGRQLQGLARRRSAERKLFLS